jgi:hypothetical protein
MDQEAREWAGLRGSCWQRKSSCIDKLYLWHYNSTNCLRDLMDPCPGGLAPLALEEEISLILSLMENRFLIWLSEDIYLMLLLL